MKSRTNGFLLNFIFCFSIFYASIFLSWQAFSLVDFGYSALYPLLNVPEMSKKYPPSNPDINKRMFIFTEKSEHERLFGEIAHSINNKGVGLEDIKFQIPQTEQTFTLLNDEEILHLQDVANVVTWFKLSSYFFICLAVLSFILMIKNRVTPVRLRYAIPFTFGFIGAAVVAILLIGAKPVFYFLHEIVFKENKWFFFYQESLMTVVMHAPDIFAWISGILVVMALVFYCFLLFISRNAYQVLRGSH
jgi:hypothetical protein